MERDHDLMKHFLLTLSVSCAAVSASAAPLGRDDAIRNALTNNRELAIAALEIDRAQARLRWAGRLKNPEIEISASTDQFGLNENEGSVEVALSQRFPVTSKLRDEKALRVYDLELAQTEFRFRQRQLAYEVDKSWIALSAARRSEELQSRLLGINDKIRAFLGERAKSGEASSLDVMQATLDSSLIEQELGRTKSGSADASARLRYLIGMPPGDAVPLRIGMTLPPSPPPVAVDLQAALRNRPDYSALLVSDTLGRAGLKLALAQRWDDIAVKVFAERERVFDEPIGLERNSLVGIGISIPLPFRKKNETAIDGARIDIEKARREREAKAFEIHSQLRKALQSRLAAYELARSAQTGSLPLAQRNFEAFRRAQERGQADPLQVNRAQVQLLKLETSALDLRNDYELHDAEVRFLSGTYPLPVSK